MVETFSFVVLTLSSFSETSLGNEPNNSRMGCGGVVAGSEVSLVL